MILDSGSSPCNPCFQELLSVVVSAGTPISGFLRQDIQSVAKQHSKRSDCAGRVEACNNFIHERFMVEEWICGIFAPHLMIQGVSKQAGLKKGRNGANLLQSRCGLYDYRCNPGCRRVIWLRKVFRLPEMTGNLWRGKDSFAIGQLHPLQQGIVARITGQVFRPGKYADIGNREHFSIKSLFQQRKGTVFFAHIGGH